MVSMKMEISKNTNWFFRSFALLAVFAKIEMDE